MIDPMAKFMNEVIILTLTGIVSVMVVFLRKKILENTVKILDILKNVKKDGNEHISKKEVEKDVRIQDILAELRINCKADRCYVLQFHNGNMFTVKNHMWKISCTHESVSNGIRPCIGELQSILSSSVSDLLYALWQEDLSNCLGVKRISPENCTCSTKAGCHLPKGVYFRKIEELPEGFAKGLLMSGAIKYMLSSPLLDSENNRVGILVLDYCWEEANTSEIITCAEQVCQIASRISFELRKKN